MIRYGVTGNPENTMAHDEGSPEARRKRRYFRRLMWVVGIAAIIGIADQARALFGIGLKQAAGSSDPLGEAVAPAILLAGWLLIGWCAVQVVHRHRAPPPWAIVGVVLLVWARIGFDALT